MVSVFQCSHRVDGRMVGRRRRAVSWPRIVTVAFLLAMAGCGGSAAGPSEDGRARDAGPSTTTDVLAGISRSSAPWSSVTDSGASDRTGETPPTVFSSLVGDRDGGDVDPSADHTAGLDGDGNSSAADEAAQVTLDRAAMWLDCVQQFPVCDGADFDANTGGVLLDRLHGRLDELRTDGLVVRPPVDPAHDENAVLASVVAPGGDRVDVTFCQVDGWRSVDPGAAPDGGDVIVDDDVTTTVILYEVRRGADGRWRVIDSELIDRRSGALGCG